jgi:hypothetical protein
VFWCGGSDPEPLKSHPPSGQCMTTCAASISTSPGARNTTRSLRYLGGLSSTVPAAGALHLAGHVEGAAKEVDVLDPKAGGLAEPKTGERTERDEGAECFVCGLEDGADLGGGGQGHRRSSSTAAGECDTDARIAGDQLVGDGPAEDGADVVDPGVHRPGRESSVDHALDPALNVRAAQGPEGQVGEGH